VVELPSALVVEFDVLRHRLIIDATLSLAVGPCLMVTTVAIVSGVVVRPAAVSIGYIVAVNTGIAS